MRSSALVLRALVGGLVLALVSSSGCGPGAPEVPKSYKPFVVKDRAFKVDFPANWTVDSGARPDNTISWAKATSGRAMVRVDADVKGSLMTESLRMNTSDDPDSSPAAAAHAIRLDHVKQEISGYKETEAEVTTGKLGDMRLSQWSTPSGLKGYRATMMTGQRAIYVLCQCGNGDWAKLKPVFDRVIQSVAR